MPSWLKPLEGLELILLQEVHHFLVLDLLVEAQEGEVGHYPYLYQEVVEGEALHLPCLQEGGVGEEHQHLFLLEVEAEEVVPLEVVEVVEAHQSSQLLPPL